MEVGHMIAILRAKKGISQKALSKELNLSSAAIGLWEVNKRSPPLDKFVEVADYFSVSADLLLQKDRKVDPKDFIENIEELVPLKKEPAPPPSPEEEQADLLRETFLKLSENNQYILMGKAMELLKEENRVTKHEKTGIQEKRA